MASTSREKNIWQTEGQRGQGKPGEKGGKRVIAKRKRRNECGGNARQLQGNRRESEGREEVGKRGGEKEKEEKTTYFGIWLPPSSGFRCSGKSI
jgi:hypothetical protein